MTDLDRITCVPAVCRGVADRFTDTTDPLDTATTALMSTARRTATTDLTGGIETLATECVGEIRLIVSAMENLSVAISAADAFSGAGSFFLEQAELALGSLARSLSDGVGDYGGGTARSRALRLASGIWPDGVPPGLSEEDYVNAMLTHPRSATLTTEELAAIWPELPAIAREQFAGSEPVIVLDLVVDGGLVLTDDELDSAARSVLASPPTRDIDVDSDLADLLDDVTPMFSIDPTGVVLDRADVLIDAGQAGRDYRDAANHPVTYVALVIGLQAGGRPSRDDNGLITVVVPRDAELSLEDLTGRTPPIGGGIELTPYGKGGTAFGNTFIVPERPAGREPVLDDDELLNHENIHTYQWAAAGPTRFASLYAAESVKSGAYDAVENGGVDVDVEVDVDTWNPGPVGPSQVDIPSPVDLPFGLPDSVSIPIPQIDPPPIPTGVDVDVDVEVDIPFNTGCDNRFEQHAGLEDGHYLSCLVE